MVESRGGMAVRKHIICNCRWSVRRGLRELMVMVNLSLYIFALYKMLSLDFLYFQHRVQTPHMIRDTV